ncbi:MAG TPA: DUF6377 domain-containing protein [Bacteroidales bacterium]|nr:DUF6377 domain-containing protein [Bacteroidales bacterium]
MISGILELKWIRIVASMLLILSISNELFAQEELSTLLLKLDATMERSGTYTQEREQRISTYKQKLKFVKSLSIEEFNINSYLFKEYRPYVCDSAIAYQNRNIEIAQLLKDSKKENESKLELAYLMGSIGLYKEAVDLLESINRSKLSQDLVVDYYNTYLRVYGELAYYTQDKRKARIYWNVFDSTMVQLKKVIEPENHLNLQIKEDSLRTAQNVAEALKLNDYWLSIIKPWTPEYALVTFRRSMIYQLQGNREMQKKYLTLSAISDIQCAIKDQASLMTLSQMLYEEGNIERAYRYIRFSWSATMFYNAKLRSLQSSTILSLIDKTYQAKIENQKSKLQHYLILISSLFVLLFFMLLIIYKQNNRLSTAKKKLQLANADLNHLNAELNNLNEELVSVNHVLNRTNNELSESNNIKEVYIGHFIELCSTYINKIDDFRKKVHNKIKDGNLKEAKTMTQSQDIMDDEFEELYVNFDKAFLQLFPDFVEKVNELLNEKDRFFLKKGESLNPELRIMALMRLGICDGSKISKFLRYSLTTVYNYRTKTKNRTYLQKEEFDHLILQIR